MSMKNANGSCRPSYRRTKSRQKTTSEIVAKLLFAVTLAQTTRELFGLLLSETGDFMWTLTLAIVPV